jgi:hypothetical protein
MPLAVGGISLSQKKIVVCWPTPAGLGLAEQYMKVGICQGGECALVVVIKVIESIKNKAIIAAEILFLFIFIFFFFPKNYMYTTYTTLSELFIRFNVLLVKVPLTKRKK